MGRKSKKKEEVFHVEVITQARVVPSESTGAAIWEYFVKWANYPDSANSWEPEKNLRAGCARLLESFWSHVGVDNEDYHVGYTIKAKQSWIDKEKDFFKAEYEKVLEKERNEKKRKAEKPRKTSTSASTPVLQEKSDTKEKSPSTSDSDDDKPPQESFSALRIKIPQKRVILSPEPDETSTSSRPRKSQKRLSSDFNVNGTTEGVDSPQQSLPNSPHQQPPNSRSQSPTSLFSGASSPEVTLSSKVPAKIKATSVSTVKVKPKNSRRVTDPQAKIASMPASALVTNSGITTKQRVAQGALNPTAPKELAPSQSTSKPRLPQLPNFKKISILTSTPSAHTDTNRKDTTSTPALRSPFVGNQTSPSVNSPAISVHSPQVLSGSILSIATPGAPSRSIVSNQQAIPPSWSSKQNDATSPTLISSTPPMSEVENFLQDIMPSSLAAPLQPALETPQEPMPPKAVAPKSALPLPGRQPKLWTWTGPFYLNSSDQSLCDVKLQQLLPPPDRALGFSVVFQGIGDIQVSCIYNIEDFRPNLGVFRNAPSLALLTAHEDKDMRKFHIVSRYIEKAKKVFLLKIILDDNCIGQILFFSYAHGPLVIGTTPPFAYNRPHSLVAAVLPYTLSVDNLQRATNIPPMTIFTRANQLQKKTDLHFEHGLRILGFPNQLYSYIKERPSDRSFYIWPEWSRQSSPSIEPNHLTRILEKTRAPHVACNAEARLVFVHAAALANIHKLPRFAERRAQNKHTQFYLYGTNADLSPYISPVQEIYPCGGIVTFTPFAIRTDPLGVLKLIKQIYHHPLWAAYIVPSALGLLANLECGSIDPLSELGKKPLMMDVILEAIEAGQLSLLEAAPEKPTMTKAVVQSKVTGKEEITYLDDTSEWKKKYVSITPPRRKAALEVGVRAFLKNAKLSSNPKGSSFWTMMDEIVIADMSMMQRNPTFMSNYRRFVVIESDKPNSPQQSPYVHGLEWTPISKFDFKDNFYAKTS